MVATPTGHAESALYRRLLAERYGPLSKLLAEEYPASLMPREEPDPVEEVALSGVDPDAATHRALLEVALSRPRRRVATSDLSRPAAPESPEAWSRVCLACRCVVTGGATAYRAHCGREKCQIAQNFRELNSRI
ncbi:hypothetical protein AB0K51_09225 [Kitasatospora sp. NPDC049285]|uniref:hypothetical protein n=1 Tax=Kitasatospora sp. NPDC049285 TaxID=3157096 RepID=UPI003414DD3A